MTIVIEVELAGLEEVMGRLGALGTFERLRPAAVRATARLRRPLMTYPPAPVDSSYTRTGTLGRSWTDAVEVSPAEIRATIGTNVGYAPYVQAEEYQAEVHRGRWLTDVQVMESVQDAIVEDFEQEVRRLAGE
jgi:hypothetical protein